ncbi:flagellar export protein FliJ [Butyrivibrio sp. MC2013]|uniref:flagellar export protein FliJ n=1 Tax=Butyrivibrio sp. MC2013 TaxID=1280686 RepID=UPI0003FF37A0|nr:flagellar export protein FliJ [Butyrivibrio sp. MC2013]
MARFRYRMQSILDLKLKTESQAKAEFGAAQAQLNEEMARLEELQNRREFYMSEIVRLQTGRLDVMEIRFNQNAVNNMDALIEAQKTVIVRAENAVDKARAKLTAEMQERKMQETLKERAFNEYLAEEKDAEYKESDQRTSFTYGRKTVENRRRTNG